jgi:hypothetical protein
MCSVCFRAGCCLFERQIREFSEFQHLHTKSSIRSTRTRTHTHTHNTHAQTYNHYGKKGEVYIKTRVVKKVGGVEKVVPLVERPL